MTFRSTLSTIQSDYNYLPMTACVLYRPIFDYNDTMLVQEDFHILQSWLKDWLMNFNASKCQSVNVTLSINATYYLNAIPLSVVDHCK